jgi:hypothetical protein
LQAGQGHDFLDFGTGAQRGQKVAIEFRDAAMPAKGVRAKHEDFQIKSDHR